MLEARIVTPRGSLYYAGESHPYDLETLWEHVRDVSSESNPHDVELEVVVDDEDAPAVSKWINRIEFRGPALEKITEAKQIEPVITVSEGKVAHSTVQRLPGPGGWRLVFDFRPEGSRPQELRAFLKAGADVLTETWSFQWTA